MNNRIHTGKYAPNHKEFGKWVDTTVAPDGSVTKVYLNGEWVEQSPKDTITIEQMMEFVINHCAPLNDKIKYLSDAIQRLNDEIKNLKNKTAIVE